MTSPVSRLARLVMLALMLFSVSWQPAAAQDSGPSILRDSETEALFRDASLPLILAANLDPNSVQVVLLGDPEINAFVATGQTVYIQSGLLLAADDVGQVQGVIAHELGHVAGGHSIRLQQGANQATGITIATMVLAVLAMAAGAGEAGMGILAAGQQAAMGEFLAFSRTQESSADQAGAKYLSKAGISGRGLLKFFSKLQNQEYRLAIYATDSYARTHPLSSERIQALEQEFRQDPAWSHPVDPGLEARFERVKAKLLGFSNPKQAVVKYPETDQSIPAHYARAYAYHVGGYPDKAQSEADALLAADPHDPYFLELKGQVLLEGGKPAEAIAPLREATTRSGNAPLIAAMLGHALVATEDAKNFVEAKQVLKTAVARDNKNPFAWYQLGIIYDREGDQARAALATAERNNLEDNPKLALASAQTAMKGIPQGSPDWLRAQDIAMVSKAELAKKDKRYRDKDESKQ
ncbi:M48 family metalloprotease [Sphingomonas hankyongi]|uniref:M48 family metalloprotease n=1 Tax=Sphingomonas hankyongi TaxID=2908209 RepID=A0ABT0RZE2_9SPHN|nr:M48 family metalloprotease [Sphingomonas hankyongi]MCL6728809.1 M48 family metalloprotease [Sphingomonas hankyongi]